MNNNSITLFAETNFRGQRKKFGIKTDDRRRHLYLIGKTGMGKTNAIENMIISDIKAGRGVALIDPHGDSAEKILDFIPSHRINDTIYFNPADRDWPIAFNVLETVSPAHKHLVASGLMGVFKKIWPDVWSPRMEYILNNTILALLDYPNSTMLGVNEMLADKDYRKKVVEKITDPIIKSFWVKEFARYQDKFATEATAAIQNKVGQFLSSSTIRNIVGQVKSSIDIRKIMDEGKIFIINLAKGRIGEDCSRLLGGMLVTKLQLAAMERVDMPEEERRDFYLYVDEFQNFVTDSFANILSEARKYRLNLIIAHQYIEQLGETMEAAVFGNVGTIVCFRVGAEDAEKLVKEFTPQFTETDLVNLTKYDVYMRLMIDGVASQPFSAKILPPLYKKPEEKGSREKIIKASRERYAQPREVIEEKIRKWSGMEVAPVFMPEEVAVAIGPRSQPSAVSKSKIDFLKPESGIRNQELGEEGEKEKKGERGERGERGNVAPTLSLPLQGRPFRSDFRSDRSDIVAPTLSLPLQGRPFRSDETERSEERELYKGKIKVSCDVCGKPAFIGFEPDNRRPIYCKQCLKKAKRGELPLDRKPTEKEIETILAS